jgi:transposase-like protein
MEEFRSIEARFPQRELDIRRRYARDASFRAVCADYQEAAGALRHWRQAAKDGNPEGDRRAEEYDNLVIELEQEILEHLDRP